MRDLWPLDPLVTHLNHGSYGAAPHTVLAKQQAVRDRMDANPMRFFSYDLPELLEDARGVLARYVSADAEDLAWVPNATAGVNAVLASLRFGPGDELLTTDHAYNACKNVLLRIAEKTGARVVIAQLPLPVRDEASVIEAIVSRATSRTKLALIDHVTSPTAVVLPIAKIIAALNGIDVLVDGAHAPGQVPVDLHALAPAYYTANCHKWLCAPKGSGFLYVRRDRQPAIHPLATSHGFTTDARGTSRFRLEFDWTGTDDPSPYLCVPEAIRFAGAMQDRNHTLAVEATQLLAKRTGFEPTAPSHMQGSMGGLLIANRECADWQLWLSREKKIEVPVMSLNGRPILRISAHGYNVIADYERLADALVSR